MASNWAIVIGINQYRFLQPLKYAKRDAEGMKGFLTEEAKFDRIFLFTDDSPPISGKPTEPFRANLLRVLRQIFATPFMKDGDNFWFFFSGHGIPHNGQDYLMPLDGDPEDIENTGISTNTITNYLRSCGADNAVMILDACRSSGKKSGEGIGRQTEAEARQTGVISLFSCSPDQYSYELEAITQGAFTYALLEGLGIRGQCATVERLNQYLENRVPNLVSQYLPKAKQIPYTIAEPLNRSHLILMPQYAKLVDIATLKNDAYRAQMNQNWDLAQRLWIRVNAAASGQDMESIDALQNLVMHRRTQIDSQQPDEILDSQELVDSEIASEAINLTKSDVLQPTKVALYGEEEHSEISSESTFTEPQEQQDSKDSSDHLESFIQSELQLIETPNLENYSNRGTSEQDITKSSIVPELLPSESMSTTVSSLEEAEQLEKLSSFGSEIDQLPNIDADFKNVFATFFSKIFPFINSLGWLIFGIGFSVSWLCFFAGLYQLGVGNEKFGFSLLLQPMALLALKRILK